VAFDPHHAQRTFYWHGGANQMHFFFPKKQGFKPVPLPWDLWAFRLGGLIYMAY